MSDATNVIVVEDDPEIRTLLANYLTREGYLVATAESGQALDMLLAAGATPDLVVLDWMLQGEDGLSICRRLRTGDGPAVIMLTAKDEDIDRVLGLEIGADDYVTKPFNPRVLLAHIKAVLRRTRPGPAPAAEAGAAGRVAVADLVIDIDARIVRRRSDGVEVSLTSAEFDLFHCFVTRPQRVLSRDQLLDMTSGRLSEVFDRTVDVQISRLRRKLELNDSSVTNLLRTVRNAGYILAAPVRPA